MNLLHPNIPLYTNQEFCTRNAGPTYKTNPFQNIKENGPMNNLSYSKIKSNMFLCNNFPIKTHKTKFYRMPFDAQPRNETENFNINCFENMNNVNICKTIPQFKANNKNDLQNTEYNIYKPISIKNTYSLQCLNKNANSLLHNIYLEKCRRVIIFDLDDTLVPTCWIRSILLSKSHFSQNQSLKELKKEIDLNKNCNFESSACSLIQLAKSLSHTVMIVTNARSDRWIHTVRWLFPKFSKYLHENNIPIIRTDQYREPSPLNVYEYFRYWMNAKKKTFDQILKEHWAFYNKYIMDKIDFISLGDTEFEEVATYELKSNNKHMIKNAFNIKVQTGLCLEEFVGQLKLTQVALSIIAKKSYSYKLLALSSTVQIKMFK